MAMDRWATTAIFLLISMFLTGMEAATSGVVQHPPSVKIFQGESVILNCTFTLLGLGTYSWRIDNNPIDFDSPRYKNRLTKADTNAFNSRKDASIQIKNMTECESGVYYCEIEIMGQSKAVGNGTTVTVKHPCGKRNSSTDSPFDWFWLAVLGGVTLLITVTLLIVITVLVQRNKAYALLVRECSSFDLAKEPELPPRTKLPNPPNHQEDSYLHCHGNEVQMKSKRAPQTRRNRQ